MLYKGSEKYYLQSAFSIGDTLIAHTVELTVEYLFPRSEVKFSVRNGNDDLAPHDGAFQMRVGVVLIRLDDRRVGRLCSHNRGGAGMLPILLSISKGDAEKQSIGLLYERCKRLCFHVAFKITNNREMAEDAVHDAFLSVIKHKRKLFGMPFDEQKAYIIAAVKNKSLDLTRAARQTECIPIEDADGEGFADSLDIERNYVSQEAYERLIRCVNALPEIYKTALEMRYVLDMSNKEIASALDAAPRAVSARIRRAKKMLRDMLGGVPNE
jgi:RNA polymerase sigma-70 factor (ECF subfamily)